MFDLAAAVAAEGAVAGVVVVVVKAVVAVAEVIQDLALQLVDSSCGSNSC